MDPFIFSLLCIAFDITYHLDFIWWHSAIKKYNAFRKSCSTGYSTHLQFAHKYPVILSLFLLAGLALFHELNDSFTCAMKYFLKPGTHKTLNTAYTKYLHCYGIPEINPYRYANTCVLVQAKEISYILCSLPFRHSFIWNVHFTQFCLCVKWYFPQFFITAPVTYWSYSVLLENIYPQKELFPPTQSRKQTG